MNDTFLGFVIAIAAVFAFCLALTLGERSVERNVEMSRAIYVKDVEYRCKEVKP